MPHTNCIDTTHAYREASNAHASQTNEGNTVSSLELGQIKQLVKEAVRDGAANQRAVIDFFRKRNTRYSPEEISRALWALISNRELETDPALHLTKP
jgi:hypothetical protein